MAFTRRYIDGVISRAGERQAHVLLYLKPALGKLPLTSLTVPLVQAFINEQFVQAEARGHSKRKVHTMRAVLSAALTRAMREELLTRNVAQLVELQPAAAKKVKPWTADEATRFLEAARSNALFPAFALLVLYGLRRGELLGLRWLDIDLTTNEIHVRQQLQRIGQQIYFGPVKTAAGERDLPLLPIAQKLLQYQWEERGTAVTPDDLVFIAKDGGPVRPERFYRTFLRLCNSAGIPAIKVHHVRHTTATLLK